MDTNKIIAEESSAFENYKNERQEKTKIKEFSFNNAENNFETCSDDEKIWQLKKYIQEKIDLKNLEIPNEYYYSCLPLCLLDAVFSIGAKYSSTRNVVERYCKAQRISEFRDRNCDVKSLNYVKHQIDDLIKVIGESEDDINTFARDVIKNRQRTSTKNGILKAQAVLECAKVLRDAGIQTILDFNKIMYEQDNSVKLVEENFKSIKGQKSGISFSYLKMLCGNEGIFKPDRHILRFCSNALGYTVDKDEAEKLFPEVINILKNEIPAVTIRSIDYAIWSKMKSK